MKFMTLTAFVVAGLWSGLVHDAAIAQTGETLTREEAISRAVDAAYILRSQEHLIAAKGAEIKQADLKPNPFLTAEMENFTGTGPYTGFARSEISLTYNQMFERGDKRKYRRRVASKYKDIAETEWRLIRLNIIRRAEQAYIKSLSSKMSTENLEAQVAIFEKMHATLEEYQARGQSSNLAVQNARLQLLNARRLVEQKDIELQTAKQELANLWETTDTNFDLDANELSILPTNLSRSIIDPEQSPDLKLASNQIDLAQETVSFERSKSRQDVTVNVGLRYLEGTSDVAVIAGFSMPLALYNTNANKINSARAELNKSHVDQQDATRQIQRQLLLQDQKKAAAFAQATRIIQELIPQAEKTEEIALERLGQGLANYLDVYAAQGVVADFRSQLITELERFHMAESEINRLTAKYDTENHMFDTIIQE